MNKEKVIEQTQHIPHARELLDSIIKDDTSYEDSVLILFELLANAVTD